MPLHQLDLVRVLRAILQQGVRGTTPEASSLQRRTSLAESVALAPSVPTILPETLVAEVPFIAVDSTHLTRFPCT